MDTQGQHAKIEQFTVLLKMCKGPGVEDAVRNALGAAGLFVYGELACLPTMQQLKGGEHATALKTLELFAFGTWDDYKAVPSTFLHLEGPQINKLKQLTLCTLASQSKILSYQHLCGCLDLDSIRSLEDFLIQQCMYAGILKCKLDQVNACVHVLEVFQRDVRPEKLPELTRGLEKMLQSINDVSKSLQSNVQRMQSAQDSAAQQRSAFEGKLQEAKQNMQKIESMRRESAGETTMMGDLGGSSHPFSHASSIFRGNIRGTRGPMLPDAKRRR